MIKALVVNTVVGQYNFVVKVIDHCDMMLIPLKGDKVVDHMQVNFQRLIAKSLPTYGVRAGDVEKYMTTEQKFKANIQAPDIPEVYRLDISNSSVMPVPIGRDILKFRDITYVVQLLNSDEKIAFTCNVLKKNRFGIWQTRKVMLTTTRLVYYDEEMNEKRKVPLTEIKAITKRLEADIADKFDFLVHVKDVPDLLFYCSKREELIRHIRSCIFILQSRNLPIYGVHAKIEKYMSTEEHPCQLPSVLYRL